MARTQQFQFAAQSLKCKILGIQRKRNSEIRLTNIFPRLLFLALVKSTETHYLTFSLTFQYQPTTASRRVCQHSTRYVLYFSCLIDQRANTLLEDASTNEADFGHSSLTLKRACWTYQHASVSILWSSTPIHCNKTPLEFCGIIS